MDLRDQKFESGFLQRRVRPHRIRFRRSRTPAFRASVRGWLGDWVGRDAQGVSISRQPAAISLSGLRPGDCWQGDRYPVLDRGKRGDLPIGDMSREEYHPSLGRDRAVHMLKAMRLDALARFEDADFPQMRVLGRDAAEIVPHCWR